MTKLPDQFEGPNDEYITLVNQTYTFLTTVPIPAIGIPAATMTSFEALLSPLNTSWGIAKNKAASTKAQQTTFSDNRDAMTVFMRPFVQQWLYKNALATDTIIQSTGLRLHSGTRTSHDGEPTEVPVIAVKPMLGHGFAFIVRTALGKKAKPVGVGIIRIRYFMGTGAPVEAADFPLFKDFTKAPITLTLPAANAGQDIAIAICYVSKVGALEGVYCTMVVTKVP
jgi:hypothetical protein